MSLFVASLYLLCLAFLFGSALYVLSRDPLERLNASFALLAFSLMGWVGTLFVFSNQTEGSSLLWWGRANFAAAAVAAPASLFFVKALARKPTVAAKGVWIETLLLAVLSLFTGSVDKAEVVISTGEHVTTYGPLFVLYVLHTIVYIALAIRIAFSSGERLRPQTILQLRLVGSGILITSVVATITNAVLPYLYNNFRFLHIGTLSTIAFLAVVTYTAVVHHLFNVRVIVRKTLVFAILIAFALELYQLAVEFLTRLLPLGDPTSRHIAAATVALTINAFTHEPIREWLEHLFNQLINNASHRSDR